MTTIAYRAGVIAADSRAWSGDKMPIGNKQKIRRLADGSLLGISTNIPGFAEALWKWIEAGRVYNDAPKANREMNFEILLVDPEGQVFYANDEFHLTGPLEAQFFAIGSGAQYALGAMRHGADAEAAVECGCALDVWSSHPVYALDLKVTA
jgi:ATP-dependent protease HslVU (ClpYQ) peptidase subunit